MSSHEASDDAFRILSETTLSESIVDDTLFTDVTDDGEIYTSYRIVRFTHVADSPHLHWTHRANVVGVRAPHLGVALLRVDNRSIEDSRVEVTFTQD
jgi:hypothetical protein